MKENKVYIGIDPDVDKSGVAYYDSKTKFLQMTNQSFFNLYEYLKVMKDNLKGENIIVVIEAGWENKKPNFRQSYFDKKLKKYIAYTESVKEKMASKTGRNEETGKKIVEMCEYLDLQYLLVKPTTSKIKSDAFVKITGVVGRTNQEQRDAAMLVFGRK